MGWFSGTIRILVAMAYVEASVLGFLCVCSSGASGTADTTVAPSLATAEGHRSNSAGGCCSQRSKPKPSHCPASAPLDEADSCSKCVTLTVASSERSHSPVIAFYSSLGSVTYWMGERLTTFEPVRSGQIAQPTRLEGFIFNSLHQQACLFLV